MCEIKTKIKQLLHYYQVLDKLDDQLFYHVNSHHWQAARNICARIRRVKNLLRHV